MFNPKVNGYFSINRPIPPFLILGEDFEGGKIQGRSVLSKDKDSFVGGETSTTNWRVPHGKKKKFVRS